MNLEVKESAYDKIIYFLTYLQDDIKFKIETNKKVPNPNYEKLKQIKMLERLVTLGRLVAQSNNSVRVTKNIVTGIDGIRLKQVALQQLRNVIESDKLVIYDKGFKKLLSSLFIFLEEKQ